MSHHVHYTITPVSLGGHRFAVTIDVPDPQGQALELSLPVWIPGSYLVRDFAKHIATVTARCEGQPVRVSKRSKCVWRLAPAHGPVQVSYEVYAFDLSVRGAYLDTQHGFFNGSSVFLRVDGRGDEPVSVDIRPPADRRHAERTADWRLATTLPAEDAPEWGFGRFAAADYEELIDHPVEMGQFEPVEFEVAGTPHFFVLSGRHHLDASRLAKDAARICAAQARLFGELPPMSRYLFLTRVESTGYGGLEHRASSALVCTRQSLPRVEGTDEAEYTRFLGLVSHEYFHLWNVKRIKPAAFTPYALHAENYTELLWVFEGITSYYDDLALVRSGVINEQAYAKLLATTITRVRSGEGRHHQSLAESSFDAWIKFYKPDENTANAVVSYYAKGALIALALDLTLRTRSDATLDQVMHRLWQQYGQPGVGVPEDGFEELAAQVSGLHLRAFFDAMVRGTDEPDLESLFEQVGWSLESTTPVNAPATTLGVTFASGSTRLKSVARGSCAEQAGLAAGDTLVAIDRFEVSADRPAVLLAPYTEGDVVPVHVFRRGHLLSFEVTLAAGPATQWTLKPDAHASERATARREAWLAG